MAHFRRNHDSETRGSTSTYVRAAIFGGLLLGLMYMLYQTLGNMNFETGDGSSTTYSIPEEGSSGERLYLPAPNGRGQVIHHSDYSLSYNEEHEQANWVAYELTEEELRMPNVTRHDYFSTDPDVSSRSAKHSDYTRSGYTRGHLAPAGDMAHSKTAMEESFYMSNMSPQLRPFNNGVWKELEEQTRDWAFKYDRLYITTGGVLDGGIIKKIGKNKVSVPSRFYKVLLYANGNKRGGIGYIIPNQRTDKHLNDFAMSIDEVEAETGIDFFADLLAPEQETEVEQSLNLKAWPVSKKRYRQRVDKWNNQK